MALARFLNGHEFVHRIDAGPAKGLVYPVLLPGDKGVWTATYERAFAETLASAVRPNGVCIDVGGWRGYFGAVMALAGASQVVIFEPFPENCDRISRLCSLNPRLPLRLERLALGDRTGQAEFSLMDESSMGKLNESSFQAQRRPQSTITVPIETLDHWYARHNLGGCDVIKIDVEGAEVMVLSGAREVIKKHRPTTLVEIHSRELLADLQRFAHELDYDVMVLETGRQPDGITEPEVCHAKLAPRAKRSTSI
jgi:FkbM family methyltransferase